MTNERSHPVIHVEYPDWVNETIDWDRSYHGDDERMRLAIAVARENVERGTGGPFGAAVFNSAGHLISVGMNSVVRHNNCTLHGEMVAFMMAQQRLGTFVQHRECTLGTPILPLSPRVAVV
jgi:tRNA(Arg) A34 adenosine deaminase TadA